ncbi:hypothetical protein [Sessilibacter sp. MAH4]
MMIYKGSVLALGFALLTGCATTNQFTVAEYDDLPDEKLPPVSIYFQTPSDELSEFCSNYDKQSAWHFCATNNVRLQYFYEEFKNTNLFENVYYAESDVDFNILISVANYSQTSGKSIGQNTLSAATLLIAPLTSEETYRVDAALVWNGELIEQYQQDIPFVANSNLFTVDQNDSADIAKSITSHIVKDFQERNVFAPENVNKKLKASNYVDDLKLPEFASDYALNQKKIFHNPLFGTVNRYVHEQFEFDYVDVFVYPVRHWDLSNSDKVLIREMDVVKHEINIFLKEQGVDQASFNEVEIRPIKRITESGETLLNLASLSGSYTINDGGNFKTVIYLCQLKDKFVKYRVTFEDDADLNKQVEFFVENHLQQIEVPNESLFMAKIRQSWRANSQESLN